jgi:hypothetical protein
MVADWSFLDRYEPGRFLDRMAAAGVRSLAFGASLPLVPDPGNYADSPVKPRPPPDDLMARRPGVERLFAEARRRGIGVYAYGTCPHMGRPVDAYRELPQKVRLDGGLTPRWPDPLPALRPDRGRGVGGRPAAGQSTQPGPRRATTSRAAGAPYDAHLREAARPHRRRGAADARCGRAGWRGPHGRVRLP